MHIRVATETDIDAIRALLRANVDDVSLFQQPEPQVRRTLFDFRVAVDESGEAAGCAALRIHRPGNAEILAVAVAPARQRAGIGQALVLALTEEALARGTECLWLATAKPGYFARLGFVPFSRWSLPLRVIATKLRLILQQPVRRWLPALFGRHSFMRYRCERHCE